MTRRASLPGADELFRSTAPSPAVPPALPLADKLERPPARSVVRELPSPATAERERSDRVVQIGAADRQGRPKHEQKVTFYCTEQDLTDLEKVRLALRADHKLPSDRSRIVRAALAEMLNDFDSRGSSSSLVRRLKDDA